MKLKNFFLTTLTFSLILTSINALGQEQENDYSLAKVGKKIYGVYIFLSSEPYYEYDYIATIDVKITWTGTPLESFEKAISKAKKKYPYFNGMIFHNQNFNKCDLIRFKGLDVSRGGISIGSKVSFIERKRVNYGEVVELESSKDKGSVKYFNIFEEEKVKKLNYTDMTPLSDEQYIIKKEEFMQDILKYKYKVGQKVSWVNNKEISYGEIISLDNKSHKASIKYVNVYGEEKVTNGNYLDLNKIIEEDFQHRQDEQKKEIEKYKFKIGEKVLWIKKDILGQKAQQFSGEVIELNDKSHKASIKYTDSDNVEKIANVSYLDLSKIND